MTPLITNLHSASWIEGTESKLAPSLFTDGDFRPPAEHAQGKVDHGHGKRE